MLIWTDNQAAAEKAKGPSPAGVAMLQALRDLHHAETALRTATRHNDLDALEPALRQAEEVVRRAVEDFQATEAQAQ